PNIVKPYRAFIFEKKTYVVYELCTEGFLRHLVQACSPIPKTQARKIFVQLLGGIKYIHFKGIVYRDIKLENIFLDTDRNVKIRNFSYATYSKQSSSAEIIYGTFGYMAPESFNLEQRGCEVDIWSIGCNIYYLLGGNPPFYASGC
ncbi:kinase-like protein, partial [Cadophora sp. DSE1049]